MSKNSTSTSTAVAPVEPKPLNQTQLKNLQALVDGDFSDLRGSALNDLQQRLSRRKEEITRKYEGVGAKQDALHAELQEMAHKVFQGFLQTQVPQVQQAQQVLQVLRVLQGLQVLQVQEVKEVVQVSQGLPVLQV